MYLTGITVAAATITIGFLIKSNLSKKNEILYLKQENKEVENLKKRLELNKEEIKRCYNSRHECFSEKLELKAKIEICKNEKSKLQSDYIAKIDESRNRLKEIYRLKKK